MRARRHRLLLLSAGLLAAGSCARAPRPPRPNVLLISVDALRQDHMSLYGYGRETTPRLDALAAESIVFDRAECTAPWTLISHMSMLTGLFARQHGVVADGTALSQEVPTLAERLLAQGYHTEAFYFEGWIAERFGHLRGFQRATKHVRGDELDRHLCAALDARPEDAPFFFFVHVWDVHCQNLDSPDRPLYDPPDEYADLFLPGARERLAGIPAADLWKGRYKYDQSELEALVALYDASIRYADALIGSWVERLRTGGVLDDTLVIVTSDHGEGLGDRKRRLMGHGELWEDGLRVPLLVRLPGGRMGGTRRDELASEVDIVPTVLELLDLPRERWLPGHSLLEPLPPDRLHLAEQAPGLVIYRGTQKVVDSTNHRFHPPRAYDLSIDPGELRPIALADEPEEYEALRAPLLRAVAELEERLGPLPGQATEARPASADELNELRRFGYFGEEDPDEGAPDGGGSGEGATGGGGSGGH